MGSFYFSLDKIKKVDQKNYRLLSVINPIHPKVR
nr:MAG TPA: hypothetical protein [Caudoviricetes sp.]